jgi:MYXO-CTERM domain-containing protein
VAGEVYFDIHGANLSSNAFGLLHGTGESEPADSPTPTWYAMVLWGVMGDQLLGLTETSDPGTGVSCYASSRGDGSIQVLIINKGAASQSVEVQLGAASPDTVGISTLVPATDQTSMNVTYNGAMNPAPASLPAPTQMSVGSTSFTETVPAYSIALLDFAGSGALDGGQGLLSDGGDKGSDDAGDAGIGLALMDNQDDAGVSADAGTVRKVAKSGCSCGSSGADAAMLAGLLLTAALRRRRATEGP